MKKIFALWGKHDSGKSQTILKVIDVMRNLADEILFEEPYGEHTGHDVAIVIKIKGVIIGITSRGDREEQLKYNLEIFLEQGCVVILCPTRSQKKTVTYTEKFSRDNNYELVWIEKTRSDDEKSNNKLNHKDAESIINQINSNILPA